MTPACPDDDVLVRFAHGGVTGEALPQLEAHLDTCHGCRTLVAAVAAGSAPAPPGPDAPVLRPGQQLGRYEVERLLGAGGMGVLYLARDPKLGRRVAVKLMRPHFADDVARARLLREAQAMAQLAHPNVVSVFDLGELDERVFVAMEYVEGGTLREWLKTPRAAAEVVAVFLQAGAGLAAAHRAGLVHRDFKPENVLIGADGRVRVTDFGLARAREPAEGPDTPEALASVELTQTGAVLGTPAYMSPEQLDSKPAGARSDQYSFCVALHEALVGRRPFEGRTLVEVRAKVLAGGAARPPAEQMPDEVWRVVERGLAIDPGRRFESMQALLDGLAGRPRSSSGRAWIAASLVAGLGLVVVAALVGRGQPDGTPGSSDWPAARTAVGAAPAPTGSREDAAVEAPALVEEFLEPVVPEALPGEGVALAVEPGASRLFDVTGASRVAIANPAVADVTVEEATLTLSGVGLGATSLALTSHGRTRRWPVTVRAAVESVGQSHALFVGAQRVLDVPGLARVAVGNSAVVDVRLPEADQVLLDARAEGVTNVLVWTRDARRIEYRVTVSSQAASSEPDLELEPGIQTSLTFQGLRRFSVGSADVCAVRQVGEQELLLVPRRAGRTTLLVWLDDGQREGRTLTVRGRP
ncbi:MAG: pilus assembly protein N-terminal domain-containing protein [Myxococcales bacterium]|nr:pilus assembly protein N-terminal domain-containing protein [Myxococcales bacterium]